MSSKYKEAGVDVEAGYAAVDLMKKHVEKTMRSEVLGGIGSFGGAFELDLEGKNITKPVLVSGTDGVGTKLKLAHLMDKHDTIGIDCVAMCVNDIACSGAEPLFFLDYIACGKNDPKKIESIVKGVADGCVQAGCALVGGETAEMPGFYAEDEYDLAGFSVGVVDKAKFITTDSQEVGDVLVGIQSSGVHSNGFSLVRKVFEIDENAFNTLKILHFEKADKNWLEYVSKNRKNLPIQNDDFDLIIGPVANDKTMPVISLYFSGIYDMEETIKRLLVQKLNNQYTFKTKKSLEALKFTEAKTYDK